MSAGRVGMLPRPTRARVGCSTSGIVLALAGAALPCIKVIVATSTGNQATAGVVCFAA